MAEAKHRTVQIGCPPKDAVCTIVKIGEKSDGTYATGTVYTFKVWCIASKVVADVVEASLRAAFETLG